MKSRITVREIALFGMFGALMFLTKYLMQAIPNIHLLAMFIAAFTVVYRWKALIPLYVYVLIDGVVGGFAMWWIPYLYIWLTLWAAVMLVSFLMPALVMGRAAVAFTNVAVIIAGAALLCGVSCVDFHVRRGIRSAFLRLPAYIAAVFVAAAALGFLAALLVFIGAVDALADFRKLGCAQEEVKQDGHR